jgi:hypothetical protein
MIIMTIIVIIIIMYKENYDNSLLRMSIKLGFFKTLIVGLNAMESSRSSRGRINIMTRARAGRH